MRKKTGFYTTADSKMQKILEALESADYNVPFSVNGVPVWKFGKDDFAVIVYLDPSQAESLSLFGVHHTKKGMALHIHDC